MVSGIYNRFFANLMNKLINLGNGGDVLKVMLLNNTHAFNADNNIKGDIVANEITGTLYTAGGKTLGSQTVTQDDVSDLAKFDGADVIWGIEEGKFDKEAKEGLAPERTETRNQKRGKTRRLRWQRMCRWRNKLRLRK